MGFTALSNADKVRERKAKSVVLPGARANAKRRPVATVNPGAMREG